MASSWGHRPESWKIHHYARRQIAEASDTLLATNLLIPLQNHPSGREIKLQSSWQQQHLASGTHCGPEMHVLDWYIIRHNVRWFADTSLAASAEDHAATRSIISHTYPGQLSEPQPKQHSVLHYCTQLVHRPFFVTSTVSFVANSPDLVPATLVTTGNLYYHE